MTDEPNDVTINLKFKVADAEQVDAAMTDVATSGLALSRGVAQLLVRDINKALSQLNCVIIQLDNDQ